MTLLHEATGKFSYTLLISVLLISAVFLALPANATKVQQTVHVNGTGSIANQFLNDDMCYEHIVYIDGEAYLTLSYDDGSEKLIELEQYISSQESTWSSDGRGISMSDVVEALDKAARYRIGEIDYISPEEQSILTSIDAITASKFKDFYSRSIQPINDALRQQQSQIQSQSYEIESLYRTLEKTDPDVYCQSRMEVVKKYGLPSVKCGLHSKRCYNGDQYNQEGGRDFCVHTEEDIDYLPCYNTFGRCGTLDEVKILDSEANSYTPVRITFTNGGTMALQPNISFVVQDPYSYEIFKKDAQDLGEVLPGETKVFTVYFDNTGLVAGKTYSLITTVQSGRKEVLETSTYSLKPEGTYEKKGTFTLTHSDAEYKKPLQITGTYNDETDNSFSVNMIADVFLEGKKYDALTSGPVPVIPGEPREITIEYKPEAEGNYTVQVRIENTDIKESFDFEIVRPTVTEMFADSVSDTTGDFAEINTSTMAPILGVLVLIFCVISTVNYWKSSKARVVIKAKHK